MSDYIATIGIECHVQLKTKTKLFAAVDNDARSAKPNTLVSHICFGLPGALPVLNEQAIVLATKAAFALNTEPQKFSKFDRKHYFYPDLPMGYQITQFEEPIILGGFVEIEVNGKAKKINITRAHLEADAGKSSHPSGASYSLVDLNRAGTPLLEIVSEPEIHSPEEAKAYAHALYLLMKYADVSDVDLYHGNMRFDVNVSLSKDPSKLGTRTETKNLNSFRSVEKAVAYEIKRQTELLDKGETIPQETRGWDDAKQKTFSQRSKEDAHDYRYFPDPDLPPVRLTDSYIEDIKKTMPKTSREVLEQMLAAGIDQMAAKAIIEYKGLAYRWLEVAKESSSKKTQKRVADWFANEVLSQQLRDDWDEGFEARLTGYSSMLNAVQLVKLSDMVDDGRLSGSAVKSIVIAHWRDLEDAEKIAKEMNLIQESDESTLLEAVRKVLAENPKAAEDVKNGEMKAIGFLVGQVMKETQGKANPPIVQKLIKSELGI